MVPAHYLPIALEHLLEKTIESTMILAVAILLTAVAVNSQEVVPANYRDYRNPYASPYYHSYDETPKPYSFSYNAPLDDGVGHSSRVEAADGSGRVQGSYTVTNDEGHTRVVDYIADQDGFRASIRTNEPGTDNKNPADVVIESSAPLTPYQYIPRARRQFVAPAANPVIASDIAAVVPEIVPENVLAPGVQPGFYNSPHRYRNRNQYRPRARYPYAGY